MNNYILTSIIMSIKQTGSIEKVFDKKFTYGQIGRTIVEAINQEYLIYENERYCISEKGEEFFKNVGIFEPLRNRKKYKRNESISLDDIYIPKYNGGNKKRNIEN